MIKKHTILTLLRPMIDELVGKDTETNKEHFREAKSNLIKGIFFSREIFPEYRLSYYNDEMDKRNLSAQDTKRFDYSEFDAQQVCLLLTFLFRQDHWLPESEILKNAIASGRVSKMLGRLDEIDESATDDGTPGHPVYCPFCGSVHTASQAERTACIYACSTCRGAFGDGLIKELIRGESDPMMRAEKITFSCETSQGDETSLYIDRSLSVFHLHRPSTDEHAYRIIRTRPERWEALLRTLFDDLFIWNWKRNYSEDEKRGKRRWHLKITGHRMPTFSSRGKSRKAPLFEHLRAALLPLLASGGINSWDAPTSGSALSLTTSEAAAAEAMRELAELNKNDIKGFATAIHRLIDNKVIPRNEIWNAWDNCQEALACVYGDKDLVGSILFRL